MADNLAPVNSLMLIVEDELAQLPLRTYPMLALVAKNDAYQREVKWTVGVGGATATGRATNSAGAIAASTDTNVSVKLSIGDRVMGHRFDVMRNDIVEARRTGPRALASLFQNHVQTGFDTIFTTLNAILYTGDGSAASHGLFGLQYAATATNVSYAGISSATYPQWEAYQNINGTNRAMTRALLGDIHLQTEKRGSAYNAIFTTPELVEKYDQLFADQASTTVNVAPMGYADLGFTGYSYKGRPIIADPACPANDMYFVNTSGVSLYTFNLAGSGDKSVQSESQKTMGLNILVSEINNENPHVLSYEISLQPQLKVTNRRKDIARLGNITQ